MSYITDATTLNGQQPSFYNGGQLPATVSKTGAYTAAATDSVILLNATGGIFTITLPVAGITSGKTYYLKMKALSANVITVAVTGGATIDGAASLLISSAIALLNYQIVFDGTNYWIV